MENAGEQHRSAGRGGSSGPVGPAPDEAINHVPDIADAVVVGRGGFAVVYRAVDLQAGRPVAVKLLSLDLDEGELRHFERERDAMARLSTHPNVVTLHRTGIAGGGTPYLVMEFASGGSLGDLLRANGPMRWNDAVAWLEPICEAVEHAHQQGIRHRDIKPQNILISAHNRPLLSDFGIAGLAVGSETITRKANLSLSYASPEQVEGKPLDDSTDVYSLGATLHTLISGTPPFSGGDPGLFNAAKRILEDAPPSLDPSVPGHVRDAVTAALAKDPASRPTIQQFRAALEGSVLDTPRHPAEARPQPVEDLTAEYGTGSTAHMPFDVMATGKQSETGRSVRRAEPEIVVDPGAIRAATDSDARKWVALALVGLFVGGGLAIAGLIGRGAGDTTGPGSETEVAGPDLDVPVGPDQDGDGVSDDADNCPTAGNQDQADTDGDGQGDVCDPDDDNDEIPDDSDNCRVQANADQNDVDGDRLGDVCDDFPDRDRDGIIDTNDPCVTDPNPPDFDGDGLPDQCDSTPRGMMVTTASAEIVRVTVVDGDPEDPANLFGMIAINDASFSLPEISGSNEVRPGNWVTEAVAVEPESPLVRVRMGLLDEVGFCLFCDDRRVDLSPDPDSIRLSLVIDTRTGAVDLATESWNRLNTVGQLSGPDDGDLSGTINVQGDDDGDLMGSLELRLTLGREPVQ